MFYNSFIKTRSLQVCIIIFTTVLIIILIIFDGSVYPVRRIVMRSQVPLIVRNETINLPWWDGGECSNRTPIIYEDKPYGHCGRRASAIGPGQKVISLCLYGKDNGYFDGIEDNLKRIKEFYPGYYLRVHVNPRLYKEKLCPLLIKYDHLHVCDITNLPSGLEGIDSINSMGWRFIPLGDEQVDVILVRDSDSRIIPREISAVNEWLDSGRTLHVMKDWSYNGLPIPGGVWGVRVDHGREYSIGISMRGMLNTIRERMFEYLGVHRGFGHDMRALNNYLYPIFKNDMVRHDSFNCKSHPGSWPWPTQKNITEGHVGQRHFRTAKFNKPESKCPIACRPPNHQDWEYC